MLVGGSIQFFCHRQDEAQVRDERSCPQSSGSPSIFKCDYCGEKLYEDGVILHNSIRTPIYEGDLAKAVVYSCCEEHENKIFNNIPKSFQTEY